MSNGNRPHSKVTEDPHAELFEHFSECRVLGHDWQHFGRDTERRFTPRFVGCYALRSRCRNCSAERYKWLTRYGLSAGSEYIYPDYYQQRGEDKYDRAGWGGLFIRSHLGEIPAPPPRKRAA